MRDAGLPIRSIVARMMALGLISLATAVVALSVTSGNAARLLMIVGMNSGCIAIGWWLIIQPLRGYSSAQRFASELHRGHEMALSRDDAFDVTRRALATCGEGFAAYALVADSSFSHFESISLSAPEDGSFPACGVEGPQLCPVARSGQRRHFESSSAVDSCPRLAAGGCSATCIPIHLLGRATGVLHLTGAEGNVPKDETMKKLVAVAEQLGDSLGRQQVADQSELQASTDSLTGLFNRRSIENRVRELSAGGHRYALAMVDLDHFKTINDTFGHERGDRALRTFARVLKTSARNGDIVGRFGGDEFVVVFPDCEMEAVQEIFERFRSDLADALFHVDLPPFTYSAGVADTRYSSAFEDVLRAADRALLSSKAAGRNRVALAGDVIPTDLEELPQHA